MEDWYGVMQVVSVSGYLVQKLQKLRNDSETFMIKFQKNKETFMIDFEN